MIEREDLLAVCVGEHQGGEREYDIFLVLRHRSNPTNADVNDVRGTITELVNTLRGTLAEHPNLGVRMLQLRHRESAFDNDGTSLHAIDPGVTKNAQVIRDAFDIINEGLDGDCLLGEAGTDTLPWYFPGDREFEAIADLVVARQPRLTMTYEHLCVTTNGAHYSCHLRQSITLTGVVEVPR